MKIGYQCFATVYMKQDLEEVRSGEDVVARLVAERSLREVSADPFTKCKAQNMTDFRLLDDSWIAWTSRRVTLYRGK